MSIYTPSKQVIIPGIHSYETPLPKQCGASVLFSILNTYRLYAKNNLQYSLGLLDRILQRPKEKRIRTQQLSASLSYLGVNHLYMSSQPLDTTENIHNSIANLHLHQRNAITKNMPIREVLRATQYVHNTKVFQQRETTIADIYRTLDQGKPIIALMNYNKYKGKPGYSGHYVIITGYSGDHLLVNNLMRDTHQGYQQPLHRDLLMKVLHGKGTDGDMIVIENR